MQVRSQDTFLLIWYHIFDLNYCTNTPIHNSFSTSYHLTACCPCVTMVALSVSIRVNAQRLHVLPSLLLWSFWIHGRWHSQMISEIMSSTSVIRDFFCQHGVEAIKLWIFIAYLVICTTMSTPATNFSHMRVGMGCHALHFRLLANYLFKMSGMLVCLQNVQHTLSSEAVENLPRPGLSMILRLLVVCW